MSAEPAALILVVMGVSGSGKSTIARELANRLGWSFEEGDELHPKSNIAKMRSGIPLDDADRKPWLEAIAAWIDNQQARNTPGVITCSALKRRYRDAIIDARSNVRLVYLRGNYELIASRLAQRHGHFMPTSLLQSQFDVLEEPAADENAVVVDAAPSPVEIVNAIIARLHLGAPGSNP